MSHSFFRCILISEHLILASFLLGSSIAAESNPQKIKFEVEVSRTVALTDGSKRKLILERVKPPVIPPRPAGPTAKPVDPALRAAHRAAWARMAKKERRILSLTGIQYPNGQTLLHWFTRGPDGQWQTYEAWTITDFRAVGLIQQVEMEEVIFDVFASIHPATRWDSRRPSPGPLYFPEGSAGFLVVKGDPSWTPATDPIAGLHELLWHGGPKLTTQWLQLKASQEAEAAWLKANPPPVEDLTVRYWPGPNMKLHPIKPARTGYRRRQ